MEIPKLKFTRLWTNHDDFPTVETREEVVRSDMQLLFNEIRDYINATLSGVVSTIGDTLTALQGKDGAGRIGFRKTAAIDRENVQDAIECVQAQLVSVSKGGIADGAVTPEKVATGAIGTAAIANAAVTYDKIKDKAVGSAKLADNAVSAQKIATNAVQERQIFDGSVTQSKLAAESVSTAKLAANAVTPEKLAQSAVTMEKLAEKCVTKEKIDLESLVTHVGYNSDGAAGRTINVGGAGLLLFIYGNSKYGFVFPWGSVYAAYGTVTWQWQDKADIKFENGVLTFVTANAWANEAGHAFVYQML
mgnify:CR=1 FL=1|nr:MAG TPA: Tail fiber protein [Caudoviricetes sp.]